MKGKKNKYGINPLTGERFKAQWEVILHYLRHDAKYITSMEAITDFGFTRLSDIIYKIEHRANIRCERERIFVPTRYGGRVSVARYWLPETEEGEK